MFILYMHRIRPNLLVPEDAVHYAMLAEMSRVMYPSKPGFGLECGRPLQCSTLHKWENGVRDSLKLKEKTISIEPWQMAVCGDYIGERNPNVEVAAISGIEAADRVLGWMLRNEGKL